MALILLDTSLRIVDAARPRSMDARDVVLKILAEELDADPDSISEKARLEEDLGADSPNKLEIALGIEEELGMKVPDSELAKFRTVGDVVNYVFTRLGS